MFTSKPTIINSASWSEFDFFSWGINFYASSLLWTICICLMFCQAAPMIFFKTLAAIISGNRFLYWHNLLCLQSHPHQTPSRQAKWSSVTFPHNRVSSALSAAQLSATFLSSCSGEDHILPGSLCCLYFTMCSESQICVMWAHISPVVFSWQIWMTPKEVVSVRGLSDCWDPYMEELQASQVTGGGEISGESVQRLIKRKWCNFVENSNSVSMGIQSSFWHRDRLAFWKTANDKERKKCEELDSFSV